MEDSKTQGRLSDLEIMQRMAINNEDIACTTAIVELKTVKKGGLVTMGVDASSINKLMESAAGDQPSKHVAIIYIVNMEQFRKHKGV